MKQRQTLQPIIQFNHVHFQYDSQAEKNLIDVHFDVHPGETILIIGPSGSGKSTIARCINGQIPNTHPGKLEGTVTVNGRDVYSSSIFDLSLDVGTVLQDTDGQFVGLTVAEDIAFALENDCVEQTEMRAKVEGWSRRLEIEHLLERMPHQLSGGQKQRVSISGILVNDIPILLLDEPLANLDPAAGAETMELIKSISKQHQYTTIIVEHRLEEALLADVDRVLVINDGRLVADTTPTKLLKSNVLSEIGVREPLYLNAMKYAGLDVSSFPVLGNFMDVSLSDRQLVQIEEWARSIPKSEKPEGKGAVLEVENIDFSYTESAGAKTLSNISFSIQNGDMVSIVGTNGAGKSTLAKLICGFVQPTSGNIRIDNQETSRLSIKEIADHVGFIMQNPNHMISKTMIYDEVALGLVNRGWPEDQIRERVYEALRICGLYPFRNWPISALSYGQKRRVTIASILVLDPKILILDEPTAGQDYAHYTEMMAFIQKLNVENDMTILMITHDMHLMQEYTNRTLVFDAGKLLADTEPSAVFSNPELIQAAHLAETSLYQLGKLLPSMPAKDFISRFMQYDREVPR
ncbi:ABC transporter ATP-binding protein [Atopococcus tabaci]|uniref:ABC transporter ATP-binding protein n=1 Tax=Atopococcus tabaci TaxID=269774 RepID=UPI000483A7F6|nr:ABC transporter ATP-binding protein [Atopococcus tabaci]